MATPIPKLYFIGLIVLGGCVSDGGWHHGPVHDGHIGHQVHIPPGHQPPPGQCRIWFPDRPPGHQPPPGKCHELSHEVPVGAVLVKG